MRDGRAQLTIDAAARGYGPLRLALRGEHQVDNARCGSGARGGTGHRTRAPRGAIAEGLETVEWPARLELFTMTDAGGCCSTPHNNRRRAGAAQLPRTVASRTRPWSSGSLREQDADAILSELLPVTSSVVATAADTHRAMSADELAARVAALDPGRDVRPCGDVLAALDAALDSTEPRASRARFSWRARFAKP